MLSKKENLIMTIILNQCKDRDSLLITPTDIIKLTGRNDIDKLQLERIISDLSDDRYFDLVYSDRHGEMVYCLTLTPKGRGFERNEKIIRRNLIYKLCVTVAFALLSFVIGLILRAIF